jgi:hypothetical protein
MSKNQLPAVQTSALGNPVFSNFWNIPSGQYYTCMVDFVPSCPFTNENIYFENCNDEQHKFDKRII